MYKNLNELRFDLGHVLTFHDPHLTVHERELIQQDVVDKVVYTTVFSTDDALKAKTRRIIYHLAKDLGIYSASIQPFYKAFAQGSIKNVTVPAISMKTLTYDLCRCVFRVAKTQNAAAFTFELSYGESQYTKQTPEEFVAVILGAAIKEKYTGPIFIQGGPCTFDPIAYKKDRSKELTRVKDWVERLIAAGFCNIAIDGSTLIETSNPSLHAQQKENVYVTAEVTKFIRDREQKRHAAKLTKGHSDSIIQCTDDAPIAISAAIEYTNDDENTLETVESFMNHYLYQIPHKTGISNLCVKTPTVKKNTKKPGVNLNLLESIGQIAREAYGLAGPTLQNTSLPVTQYEKFVKTRIVEAHLSTAFQDEVFDALPANLRGEMYAWVKKAHAYFREPDWNDEEFIHYKREKAFGLFKKKLWHLSDEEKKPIIHAVETYIGRLFEALSVANTKKSVEKYVS